MKTFALITLLFTACTAPDEPVIAAPLPTTDDDAWACEPGSESNTSIWIRFWRDGIELDCASVLAAGFHVEIGPLGSEGVDIATPQACAGTLDRPEERYGATFNASLVVGRFTAMRLVDADGLPVSVEHSLAPPCAEDSWLFASVVL